jgi:ketosteroid isomerase-like protein
MKINLLILILLLMSAGAFAQTTPTADLETAMNQFLAEYNKSPYDFFKERTTDDFRYIDRKGAFVSRPVVLKGSEGRPSLESSTSDLKIFQSGDLAVVSGIQSFGNAGSGKTAFTYTYTLRKITDGAPPQWMFAASQHTLIQSPQSVTADEEAIKSVIENLTAAMYARYFKTYLSYWVNAPYASRVSTDRQGAVTKTTGDDYRKTLEQYAAQNLKPSGEKATRANWLIRVNGNSAFVIFDQHNEYPDGTNRDSVEERYLERVNNEWKMVNVTVLPKK